MADTESAPAPAPVEEEQKEVHEEPTPQKRPLDTDDAGEDAAAKSVKLDSDASAPAPAPEPAPATSTNSDTDNGVPSYLPKGVQDALERLYASGQVGRHDLDKQALDSLRDFSEDVAIEVVDKYREADLTGIRNKTAFFIGIIKRYRSRGPQQPAGFGAAALGPAAVPAQAGTGSILLPVARTELFPSTQKKLDDLYARGKATAEELGESTLSHLKIFTEETANTVVDKFAEADTSQIRNKSGFLMGIMRRFQDQAGSATTTTANLVAFQSLPYSVQMRLSPYYQNGVIGQNDIEAKVFQSLAQFNEHTCNEMISKFLESDLTRVSNKSGWLIGIIKRFRSNGAVSHPSNAALHQANNQQILAQMSYGGGYAAYPHY